MEGTHPNFRSIVQGVMCADDIFDLVGTALLYQNMFDKRTSPWEMSEWDEGELETFEVSAENIDRVYHIYHYDDGGLSGREFQLLARMDYKGRSVFVELLASCDSTGFDCQGGGEIYVSSDAQVYLTSIVGNNYDHQAIWGSMVDDGLQVEEPTEFDMQKHWERKNVPMLKLLCHETVYDEQEKLQHYDDVLPHPLSNSIKEFVKVRGTKDHHDNGF